MVLVEEIRIGGWGIAYQYGDKKRIFCGELNTTKINELKLLLRAKALTEPCIVNLTTDSIMQGITSWIDSWKK